MATPISNTPYARALYDYNAAGNINRNGHSDVSFRKGEFVEILTQKPFGGWMLARLESTGSIGYFPMNYFQMSVYKDKNFNVPVIVLHDYVSSGYLLANGDKDLSVKKGEVIYQIDPNINNGWIRVKSNNNGEVGVIPSSYVAKLSGIEPTPSLPQYKPDKSNNNSTSSTPRDLDCETPPTITPSTSSDNLTTLQQPTSNDTAPPSQDTGVSTIRMIAYSAPPALADATLLNERPVPPAVPPKTPPTNPNAHEQSPHQSPYHSNTLPPSRPPLAKAASQIHISELTREMSLLLQERRRKSNQETAVVPASPETSPREVYPRVATPIPSRKPAPPKTPKPAHLIEEILQERPRAASDEGSGNMSLPGLVSDDPHQRISPRSPRSPRPVPVSVPSSCVKCGKAGHWADSCPEGEEEKQEEGITFTYHKGKTMIKAATKERLIEGLYSEGIATYDFISEYVDVFLLTYRTFVTPKELLQTMCAVYQEACTGSDEERANKKPKRARICNFLKKWMENFSNDFESDPDLMQMYEAFVADNTSKDESLMTILTKTLRRRGFKPERRMSIVMNPPKPMIPKAVSFFDIEPVELARQMCLMDFEMFKSIGARELLAKHWVGSSLVHSSPNLWKMIQKFNQFSNWVAHCVVREESAKKRAAVIQRFLKVGKECLALNNFNAVFQITSGLHSSAVHRLKKSWDVVKKEKEYGIFEELETVTATRNSFVVYRERLRSANPPCIPFFGVYQSDLTFIADGNPDIFDNGYINFFKRRLVAEVIKEIQTFQQTSYILNEVEVIQTWLKSQEMETLDQRTIYGISLVMEPREGSSEHLTEKVKSKAKAVIHKEKKRRDSFSIPTLDGLKSFVQKSSSPSGTMSEKELRDGESPGRKSKLNKFFGEQNINFDFYVKYSQASSTGSLDEQPAEEPPQPVERPEYAKITATIDLTPQQIEQYKKEQIAKYLAQHGQPEQPPTT